MEVYTLDKIKKYEIFFSFFSLLRASLSSKLSLVSNHHSLSSELLPLFSYHPSFSNTISLLRASPFGLQPPIFLQHHLSPSSFSLLWSQTNTMHSLLEDDDGGGGVVNDGDVTHVVSINEVLDGSA